MLYRGELPRGDTAGIVGTGERQARRVVSVLIERGVLSRRAAVRPCGLHFLRLSHHAGCRVCFLTDLLKKPWFDGSAPPDEVAAAYASGAAFPPSQL